MSVTVKVFCQLAVVFLVAFLDRGIATRDQNFEFNEPKSRSIRSNEPYSEFVDDVVSSSREYQEVPIRYYESERRNVRSRRYAEESEFQEPETTGYDKEQYWNQDEVEVEEDTHVEEDPTLTRTKRQSPPPQYEVRYKNHRYEEPDNTYEESRRVPVSRKNQHYEVYESGLDEPESSETRVDTRPGPPERFVYQGVQYVRAPEQAPPKPYYARRDGSASSEHYHRVPGSEGSPPVSRYQKDQSEAATGKAHGHHHSSGGGHQGHDKHSATHGHKDDKGYKSVHHNEHGAKGVDNKEKHAKHYDEHGGKKNSHHDSAGHYGQHHEAAQGHKGGKFDEKKGHKKGHNTKEQFQIEYKPTEEGEGFDFESSNGYHNKYHKDEYHKEHKFYDDYHKSGSHSKYGNFNSKHASQDGGHKKKEHLDSSNHSDHAGKKGHHAKGHVDEDHKAHKNEKGYEKHHAHHSDYGKKGGHQDGNVYAYHTKH